MKEVEDLKTLAKAFEATLRRLRRLEQRAKMSARRRGKRGKH
jgi:hypothetical protein